MADKSKIEWTDATWNPIRGCSRVSEGCRHCYAERQALRFRGAGQPYEGLVTLAREPGDESKGDPRWTGAVRFVPELLDQPLRWKKPRKIFVNSMSDLFHEKLAAQFIFLLFKVMAQCPQHTFQILTKRAERMQEFMSHSGWDAPPQMARNIYTWPLPNVWLGVSVEDQKTADERIPLLLRTPAAVRWVSYEPALGPVDFHSYLQGYCPEHDFNSGFCLDRHHKNVQHLNWIVAGGESGPHARPSHPDWFRAVRDQCNAARVPFHFKQWGEWMPVDEYKKTPSRTMTPNRRFVGKNMEGTLMLRAGKFRTGRLLDGREWREFPAVAADCAARAGKPAGAK